MAQVSYHSIFTSTFSRIGSLYVHFAYICVVGDRLIDIVELVVSCRFC